MRYAERSPLIWYVICHRMVGHHLRRRASWEIPRYRFLRRRLLVTYRQKATEAALRSIDMVGMR